MAAGLNKRRIIQSSVFNELCKAKEPKIKKYIFIYLYFYFLVAD